VCITTGRRHHVPGDDGIVSSFQSVLRYCVPCYACSTGQGREDEYMSPIVSELELEFCSK
jgi:hypothetical protein